MSLCISEGEGGGREGGRQGGREGDLTPTLRLECGGQETRGLDLGGGREGGREGRREGILRYLDAFSIWQYECRLFCVASVCRVVSVVCVCVWGVRARGAWTRRKRLWKKEGEDKRRRRCEIEREGERGGAVQSEGRQEKKGGGA